MKTTPMGGETEREPASPFEELLEAVAAATDDGAPPKPPEQTSLVQLTAPAPENGQSQPAVMTGNTVPAGEGPPAAVTIADPVVVAIASAIAAPETTGVPGTKRDTKPDDKSAGKDKAADKAKVNDSGVPVDPSAIVAAPAAVKPDAAAVPVLVAACVPTPPSAAKADTVAIPVEAPQLVQPAPLVPTKPGATKTTPTAETPQRQVATATTEGGIPPENPAPGIPTKTAAKTDTQPHDQIAPDARRTAATDAPALLPSPTLPPAHKDDAVAKTAPDAPQPTIALPLASPQPDAPVQIAPIATPPAPAAAVPLADVPIAIAGKALEGKNRFEIRLDPPELGRIEVRLDVGRDGSITSRIVADRSDTLNLLRNDAPALQRALENAGLRAGDNGLQFSLRDQNANQQQQQQQQQTNLSSPLLADDGLPPAFDPTAQNYIRFIARAGGVDIRV